MNAGLPDLRSINVNPTDLDRFLRNLSLLLRREGKRMAYPVTALDYVNGWDISNWQPIIDWPKIGREHPQLKYVYIKSTEGTSYLSRMYKKQWTGAGSIGQLRGAYHYHHTELSGTAQAKWFLKNSQKGELPPCLDVEDAVSLPEYSKVEKIESAIRSMYEFQDEVYAAWGQKAIIYTGKWFWDRMFPYSMDLSAICDLFAAMYRALDDVGPIPTPLGWNDWTLWQYTSKGRLSGCPDRVDLSVFHGGITEFNKWVYQPIPIPPDPLPTVFPWAGRVNNFPWGMFIRQGPGKKYPTVTWIRHKTPLLILDALPSGWGKVYNGWVKLSYVRKD